MRPALISRTKRRGATALAPALRSFFLTASDMWHPYCDLTRNWSALDRDCAANTCHDIEWDDHRWNGCASSSQSYSADRPCGALRQFVAQNILAPVYSRFTKGGFATADMSVAARSMPLRWSVELSARSCKSERIQTSGEMRALAKSWRRQVRHGAWRSGEA